MPRGTYLNKDEKSTISLYRECGLTIRQIADKMGRDKKTIFMYLKNPEGYRKLNFAGRKPLISKSVATEIKRIAVEQQMSPGQIRSILNLPVTTRRVQQIISDDHEPKGENKPTIDTSPNTSINHSIQSQETILNVSDNSTVDADEADNLQDEQFTYLQNLNSDNLMKFSQQSVLQQLIQEQIDIKPNLNLIPTCEEHDNGGYNFGIQINKCAHRPGLVYSKETERLYLKTNENVYIDCFYTQKMPIQPLKVRVFAVFEKDASAPVLRCQNHLSTDNDKNETVRKSLVRCKNPDAVYYGSDTGKSINDRYSVVVPLNSTVKGSEANQFKQQLIVSFTCFNSCMNRKQTAVIFLLEGMNGEILAQRTLSVKISTCPKRDRRLLEGPDVNSKRKHIEEPNFSTNEAKMPKYDNTSIKDEYSRSSFDEAGSDDGISSAITGSVHHEQETGDFVLTLKYKSRQQLLQAISAMYGDAISMELRKTCVNAKRTRDSDCLRKLYHTAYNIKTRNKPPSISTE
ncbi:cellular tumor antigen p53 isoform X2 [Calliphora vicina]|uniref:cellular tumor antigen p53 isoform X2 n=1 Tax=Calliphora vicina TaxID=7373 RepID=UPI00325BF14C